MTAALHQYFRPSRYAQLASFSGFSVCGDDVMTFLQGQLTNDVKALSSTHWHRTGYCTPKGRLLATLVQWQLGEKAVGHLLPAELMDSITKRLRMFVLRSKVHFEKLESPLLAIGLWGESCNGFGKPQESIDLSGVGQGPWLLSETPCPVLGNRCWLIVDPAAHAATISALGPARETNEEAWFFSEIQSAQAWVLKPTQESFVPQMINFEITGGVSFTKGCYPGQEVVARSQYLGKLKRRSFRADLNDALSVSEVSALCGRDLWSKANEGEPCGQVVNAAPKLNANWEPEPGVSLLIECTLEAWEKGELCVGSPQGLTLIPAKLPYQFPAAA